MKQEPAFPQDYSLHTGMTLRDYFAAKALANLYTQHDSNADKVAEWAYAVADAMMEARK